MYKIKRPTLLFRYRVQRRLSGSEADMQAVCYV